MKLTQFNLNSLKDYFNKFLALAKDSVVSIGSKLRFNKTTFKINLKVALASKDNYFMPRIIFVVIILYFLATLGIGFFVLQGKESNQLFALAKFFPIPIAQVNNQFIWFKEYINYKRFIENFITRSGQDGQAVNLTTPLNSQVVSILIQNAILERTAKAANINITQAEINQSFKQILITQNGGGPARDVSEEELNTILEELYGSDKNRLKELIRIKLIEDKIRNEIIERVKFRQILVSTEKQAIEVIERIKTGQKFEDLAKELSRDEETRDKGGEVDFIARGIAPQSLEEVLFTKEKGLVEQLVKTEFGYHIIEILERKGNIQQAFGDWLSMVKQQYKLVVYLKEAVASD